MKLRHRRFHLTGLKVLQSVPVITIPGIASLDLQNIPFIDSPAHPSISLNKHRMVAQRLGSLWPGTELWAMQVKYAALALGGGDVVIRIPPKKEFRPHVWDHAGGQLIFEEPGGRITDLDGKAIDFDAGRKLEKNYGLVAAPAELHPYVFKAVREILDEFEEEKTFDIKDLCRYLEVEVGVSSSLIKD